MMETSPAIIRYHYDENYTEEDLKEEMKDLVKLMNDLYFKIDDHSVVEYELLEQNNKYALYGNWRPRRWEDLNRDMENPPPEKEDYKPLNEMLNYLYRSLDGFLEGVKAEALNSYYSQEPFFTTDYDLTDHFRKRGFWIRNATKFKDGDVVTAWAEESFDHMVKRMNEPGAKHGYLISPDPDKDDFWIVKKRIDHYYSDLDCIVNFGYRFWKHRQNEKEEVMS